VVAWGSAVIYIIIRPKLKYCIQACRQYLKRHKYLRKNAKNGNQNNKWFFRIKKIGINYTINKKAKR